MKVNLTIDGAGEIITVSDEAPERLPANAAYAASPEVNQDELKALYLLKEYIKVNAENQLEYKTGYTEYMERLKKKEYERRAERLIAERYTLGEEISYIYKEDCEEKREYRAYVEECKAKARQAVEKEYALNYANINILPPARV
jgi:hypothetical protein